MEKYEILVIGGGPAGITMSKILGKKKKIGIIRPEDHSMIYCAMPYVIEEKLSMEKSLKKDSLVTDSGGELIRETINRVDFEKKEIYSESGKSFSYDKLVIATGADPVIPPIDGADLKGIHTFKTENDLRKILSQVEGGLKKSVVIGAGAVGIELAQALNHRGIETHLIDMADQILPALADKEIVIPAEEELKQRGINLHLNSKVVKLEGEEEVELLRLDNGESIDLSGEKSSAMVVFSVGMKPNIQIFENTSLKIDRDGIVVNEKMETNIPDVYAVGDCVQFKSGITGEILSGKLATNAVPMARMLAKNILGDNRVYAGFFNGAATKVGSYFIGGTGFTEKEAKKRFEILVGEAELTNIFPVMPGSEKIKMKLIVNKETLVPVGAQILSKTPVTDRIDLMTLAIQNKIDIKKLTSFSYSAQPYQSFFPANHLVVACSENILKEL